MFDQAISYAKEHDVSIIQLTTNKKRPKVKHFYEKLGFEDSHEGRVPRMIENKNKKTFLIIYLSED